MSGTKHDHGYPTQLKLIEVEKTEPLTIGKKGGAV